MCSVKKSSMNWERGTRVRADMTIRVVVFRWESGIFEVRVWLPERLEPRSATSVRPRGPPTHLLLLETWLIC